MCSYQFTEKQVNNFIRRNKDKKGWLSARDVRSENMPSLETRKLMQLMCDNFKVAFNNQAFFQNEGYKICFELDQKDRMIEELDRFDYLLLFHPEIMNIPSEYLISKETTPSELLCWKELLGNFIRVFKAFCRYQNGQNIEDFNYFGHSDNLSDLEKLYLKDATEHLLIKVRRLISMYKSLRIGWKEIERFYPYSTYNTFFIAILQAEYNESFAHQINSAKSSEKQIIHSRKTVTLSKFHSNMKRELERLSKCENIDSLDRELYRLTLEEYNREAHGKGRENAFAVLKKVAQKDPQVMQVFMDFHQALSIVGKFSEHSKEENFDEFLKCDGVGHFVLNYEPKSNDAFIVDRILDHIRNVMRSSDDPRVRASVSQWVEATSKILDFDVKISRRNEQNPEKRY